MYFIISQIHAYMQTQTDTQRSHITDSSMAFPEQYIVHPLFMSRCFAWKNLSVLPVMLLFSVFGGVPIDQNTYSVQYNVNTVRSTQAARDTFCQLPDPSKGATSFSLLCLTECKVSHQNVCCNKN